MPEEPKPLSCLGMLSQEEQARLAAAGIHTCGELLLQAEAREGRERLAKLSGVSPDALLQAAALARLDGWPYEGTAMLRRLASTGLWQELEPELDARAFWASLLAWDPLRLLEHWGDRVRQQQGGKARRLGGLRWGATGFAVLTAMLLAAYAWLLRDDLFPAAAAGVVESWANARLRQEVLLLMRSALEGMLLLGMGGLVALAAHWLVRRLQIRAADRLLRLRGWLALYDLASREHSDPFLERAYPLLRRVLQGLALALGAAFVAWSVWAAPAARDAGSWFYPALFGAACVLGSATIVLDLTTEARHFRRAEAYWVSDVRQRWGRTGVVQALLNGLYLLGVVALLVPGLREIGVEWLLPRQEDRVEAIRAEFDARLAGEELAEEETARWHAWSRADEEGTKSWLAEVPATLDRTWQDVRWWTILAAAVLTAAQVLYYVVAGRWALVGALALAWLALNAVAQYTPPWLQARLPIPAGWIQVALLAVIVPFILTATSDVLYAHMESRSTALCAGCGSPLPPGPWPCESCGRPR